ncbi:MAG TPA: hypothetical protein VIO11_01925 [Candidatus Methanoperedens sp.]
MTQLMIHSMLSAGSIIFALIGFFIVVRIWMKWKIIDKDVLKARVFLDKMFLEKNWIYVFLTGASISVHQTLEFLLASNYIVNDWAGYFSEILEFFALVFLIVLAYEWFRLILPIK